MRDNLEKQKNNKDTKKESWSKLKKSGKFMYKCLCIDVVMMMTIYSIYISILYLSFLCKVERSIVMLFPVNCRKTINLQQTKNVIKQINKLMSSWLKHLMKSQNIHLEIFVQTAIKLHKLTEDEKFIFLYFYTSRTHTIPLTNPLCIIHYTTIQYSKKIKQLK